MPQFLENLFSARVRTVNVIFTVISFAFAFNVTVLPIYIVTHPKLISPELAEEIIKNSTTGLLGVVMFIMGRVITSKSEGAEKRTHYPLTPKKASAAQMASYLTTGSAFASRLNGLGLAINGAFRGFLRARIS